MADERSEATWAQLPSMDPVQHVMDRSNPPAGWYPNPWMVESLRWWDGHRWTAHTTPITSDRDASASFGESDQSWDSHTPWPVNAALGEFVPIDSAPPPTEIVNKVGPRVAMVCFAILAIAPVAFALGSDLFQNQGDKLEFTFVCSAIALPLALVAWRCHKLGRIAITPTDLTYRKILGSRVIQWSEVQGIESTVIAGHGVSIPRLVIRMKDGTVRMPGGFAGDPNTLQQNFLDLQRALSAYGT